MPKTLGCYAYLNGVSIFLGDREKPGLVISLQLRHTCARRNGLYRALRIDADVVEVDAAELTDIAAEAMAQKLTAELRREAKGG